MKGRLRQILKCAAFVGSAAATVALAGGPLEPDGPPAVTMKSLDEVEPRTPIDHLPFIITQPGSYYLTKNLTGDGGSHSGIVIGRGNVTIDLNGFALVGGPSSGVGIIDGSKGADADSVVIRNGTIRDWSGDGVNLAGGSNIGESSQLENLRVLHNGRTGLNLSGGSIVSNCVVHDNGGDGIHVLERSIVKDCIVSRCGFAESAGFIGSGIKAQNSDIRGCTVSGCGGPGILMVADGFPNSIVNNVIFGNGVRVATAAGIQAGSAGRIEGNLVYGNGYGVFAGPSSRANIIIRNYASNNAQGNYSLDPGNLIGPIVNQTNMAANTNPDANHEYQ